MNLRYTGRLAVWAIVGWVFFFGRAAGAAMTGFCFFSPVFPDGGQIPSKYARTHTNISPPLDILNIVSGPGSIKPFVLKSFVLIMDDPDAPGGLFTHWLVWNISPDHAGFFEGRPPGGAVQGTNSFGDAHYDGPAPPDGKHRYFFHLYGLDTVLSLPAGSDRDALEAAMKGHIVAQAQKFYGTFATGQ
jgi:Raf kinase inhibitor-like YbhB/YbcL family protein